MSNAPQNYVSANGMGQILDGNLNAAVQTTANVTVLRAFVGITGMTVTLQGLTAAGDGGTGTFYWSAGAYTDNGTTVIVPPAATGQGAWLRAASLFAAPLYTVAGLPAATSANQGQQAYATNGRNTGEGGGSGAGCLCTVNSAGVWCAVWSGAAVQS